MKSRTIIKPYLISPCYILPILQNHVVTQKCTVTTGVSVPATPSLHHCCFAALTNIDWLGWPQVLNQSPEVACNSLHMQDGWMNQAYSRLSTTHGHFADWKLLVCMYWTRPVLVRPAASLSVHAGLSFLRQGSSNLEQKSLSESEEILLSA